eukprot:Anaeramoba_ignava/a347498_44.p1 GENE.a347498_44~~a347498_44.p1  ORF type:complete len:708 (-),score=205.83 a347498_44:24-1832(-)
MDAELEFYYIKPTNQNNSVAMKIVGQSNLEEEATISVYSYLSISTEDKSAICSINFEDKQPFISSYSSDYNGIINLKTHFQSKEPLVTSYYAVRNDEPYLATDIITSQFNHYGGGIFQLPNKTDYSKGVPNFAIIHKVFQTPFEWIVYFDSEDDPIPSSFVFDEQFIQQQLAFDSKFDSIFGSQIINATHNQFGKQVLSHLLGGLSYFYGTRYIYDPYENKTFEFYDNELYSCIPNKFYFPRPFFWDEGFHDKIVWRWEPKLFENIMTSWFNLQNETTGWIAREMIIGSEAQSRAPEWAWAGITNQMNPPIFFFTLFEYYQQDPQSRITFLKSIYPKLQKTYDFYWNNCLSTVTPYTFVWLGRVGDGTLDSGLDDYPRAPEPTKQEVDIDIQSWMVKLSYVMQYFAQEVGDTKNQSLYHLEYTETLKKMREIFWNSKQHVYQDTRYQNGTLDEKIEHVGIISVFPVCLGIEPIDNGNNQRVKEMIQVMNNTSILFDEQAGLRSLSSKDSAFMLSGNYWRGNIWINMNYMCSQGLKFYEQYYPEAKTLRNRIEETVINNVIKEYFKTHGSLWETYMPFTGLGYNNNPFNGWTTLVLLMMAQLY